MWEGHREAVMMLLEPRVAHEQGWRGGGAAHTDGIEMLGVVRAVVRIAVGGAA
jgi:hypothetical protein